jgi:hypothetical protein
MTLSLHAGCIRPGIIDLTQPFTKGRQGHFPEKPE